MTNIQDKNDNLMESLLLERDYPEGGAGNDIIKGSGTLVGGKGNDTITANVAGSSDTFIF